MQKIKYEIAGKSDDVELRRILRENPMNGSICMTFEREPSYFKAANIEGNFHQTMIAREMVKGKIIGTGSRAIRPLFVNGKIEPVGYLGLLRLDEKYRGGRILMNAYKFLHELHQDGRAKYYLTSILEENHTARRVLTSGIKYLPRYDEYLRFLTFVIVVRRSKQKVKLPNDYEIIHGSSGKIVEIIDLLQKYGRRCQFYPNWDSSNLFNADQTPGLEPEDFLLYTSNDKILGSLAIWDQSSFKQTVIRNYSKIIKNTRWFINGAAYLTGRPLLPCIGTAISYAHLSHLSVAGDDPKIFSALLNSAYNRAGEMGIDYLMIGFPSGHPFAHLIKKTYKTLTLPSRIYLVSWKEDGTNPLTEIDTRTAGLEAAIL